MKKITIRLLSLILMISSLLTVTSFAAVPNHRDAHIPPSNTKLLPEDQPYSRITRQTLERGRLLSSCFMSISNVGYGKIGILSDTRAHVDVDAMYVTIYLDRYDEESGKWLNQKVYSYEFTPEDTTDGKLHARLISFEVTDQPSGYYYRLWGYHEVEKGGEWETLRGSTDGVLITNTP